MTSLPPIIERIAFANAASAVLSFSEPNFTADPYVGLQAFATAVSNKVNPDGMSVGLGLENNHDAALEHICFRAHAFMDRGLTVCAEPRVLCVITTKVALGLAEQMVDISNENFWDTMHLFDQVLRT